MRKIETIFLSAHAHFYDYAEVLTNSDEQNKAEQH